MKSHGDGELGYVKEDRAIEGLTIGREVNAAVHGQEVVAFPLGAILGCE